MAETGAYVSFKNVVAGYGGGDVLKGVEFDVPPGGVSCIVGPNGSGKSTLLKTVSGLVRPRLGEIWFKGQNLVGKSPKEILQLGVVQVPQNHSLFREMTVDENVELGAFLVKDKKVIESRMNARTTRPGASRAASSVSSSSHAA
jgi:ABC-type branched-subunit amino acid transport system ATPase component